MCIFVGKKNHVYKTAMYSQVADVFFYGKGRKRVGVSSSEATPATPEALQVLCRPLGWGTERGVWLGYRPHVSLLGATGRTVILYIICC